MPLIFAENLLANSNQIISTAKCDGSMGRAYTFQHFPAPLSRDRPQAHVAALQPPWPPLSGIGRRTPSWQRVDDQLYELHELLKIMGSYSVES